MALVYHAIADVRDRFHILLSMDSCPVHLHKRVAEACARARFYLTIIPAGLATFVMVKILLIALVAYLVYLQHIKVGMCGIPIEIWEHNRPKHLVFGALSVALQPVALGKHKSGKINSVLVGPRMLLKGVVLFEC